MFCCCCKPKNGTDENGLKELSSNHDLEASLAENIYDNDVTTRTDTAAKKVFHTSTPPTTVQFDPNDFRRVRNNSESSLSESGFSSGASSVGVLTPDRMGKIGVDTPQEEDHNTLD